MGWQGNNVFPLLIVFTSGGTPTGLFVYDPTPAAGNLIASVSDSATDPYGDSVIKGITSYWNNSAPGYSAATLATGDLTFAVASTEAGPWTTVWVFSAPILVTDDMVITGGGGAFSLGPGTPVSPSISFPEMLTPSGRTGFNFTGCGTSSVSNATITTTGNTVLSFRNILALDVKTGGAYSLFASGSFDTGGTAPSSATFQVFWGGLAGTSIASLAIPTPLATGLTASGWFARSVVTWKTTSSVNVVLEVGWHTGSGVTGSTVYFTSGVTTGLDSTANQNLTLAFAWGSAPTSTKLVCDDVLIGRIA